MLALHSTQAPTLVKRVSDVRARVWVGCVRACVRACLLVRVCVRVYACVCVRARMYLSRFGKSTVCVCVCVCV